MAEDIDRKRLEETYAVIERLAIDTRTPLWTLKGPVYPIDYVKPKGAYQIH